MTGDVEKEEFDLQNGLGSVWETIFGVLYMIVMGVRRGKRGTFGREIFLELSESFYNFLKAFITF